MALSRILKPRGPGSRQRKSAMYSQKQRPGGSLLKRTNRSLAQKRYSPEIDSTWRIWKIRSRSNEPADKHHEHFHMGIGDVCIQQTTCPSAGWGIQSHLRQHALGPPENGQSARWSC